MARPEDARLLFVHRDCPCFPCHTPMPPDFHCLFCYCPLYPLGRHCGGQFQLLKNGVKDCSACLLPHRADCYTQVLAAAQVVSLLAAQPDGLWGLPGAQEDAPR